VFAPAGLYSKFETFRNRVMATGLNSKTTILCAGKGLNKPIQILYRSLLYDIIVIIVGNYETVLVTLDKGCASCIFVGTWRLLAAPHRYRDFDPRDRKDLKMYIPRGL